MPIEPNLIPQKKLTLRHEKFCFAYATTGNAKLSALEAGYRDKDPANQGCRLLKKQHIQDRIKELADGRKNEIRSSMLARVNDLKNKDVWLGEVLKVYEDIKNPESPQRLKALEIVGKSMSHLSETEARNLFQIDNRTINQIDIASETFKIADKLKLLGKHVSRETLSDVKPIIIEGELTQPIAPIEVTPTEE